MTIQEQIEDFFQEKGGLPGNAESERYSVDYLASGLLDSFGLIEFISYIENSFDISLSQEDLQSEDFRTVNGLSGIIERALGDRG